MISKNNLKTLLVGLCVAFGCIYTYAQQDNTLSLSLEEAQQYALEHNRTLKNASIDVQKAKATQWKSISSMLPQVSASGDYSDFCGYKMNFAGGSIPMNPSGTFGVTASVALSGAQVVAVQISKIAGKMSEIGWEQSQQQIKDQVKTLYYSALVMDTTVRLLEKNLVHMESLRQYTEASVEVGVAEQTDADRILVQIATMQTSISSSKRSLEMVYNSLRLQLGLDVDTDIHLTQGINDLMNVERAAQLLTEEFVLDNNYNYQLLKENTELSKKQVSAAKWSYGPTVSAHYQYSAKTYFGKAEGFNMTPPNMVGVSVSLPLFSSFNKQSALREAKFDYEKQLNTLEDTEESLRIQHRQLCYNLTTAYETYLTQRKNLEVTQRVLNNVANKYAYGAASSLDLTNASTELVSAQSSFVQAMMEMVNAQVALEELLNN